MATNKIKATVINLEQEVPKSGGSPWLMISEKAAASAMSSERPGMVAGSAQSLVGPKVSAGPAVALAAPATGAAILDTIKGNTIVESGTLVPLKITGIKVTGVNLWDEEWEIGGYSTTTGEKDSSTNKIRSKHYIPIMGNAYYYNGAPSSHYFLFYDISRAFISAVSISPNTPFLAPLNAAYMTFYLPSGYGTTYKHDICLNLSRESINGQYYPYEEYTLSLPVVGKTAKDGDGNPIVPFPAGMHGTPTVFDVATKDGGTIKWGVRAYEAGDESDATVITDLTNTAYPLTTPVPFTWDEPLEMVSPVAGGGALFLQPEGVDEQGIPATAPLYADIKWPVNAVSAVTLTNLMDALKAAGKITDYTMTWDAAAGAYTFTIS